MYILNNGKENDYLSTYGSTWEMELCDTSPIYPSPSHPSPFFSSPPTHPTPYLEKH